MEYLAVKNWEEFQHYKDRSPPWIKLHRDLLRDYKFSCLQDASKLLLIEIWLLASQLDNRVPKDAAWLKRQIPYDAEVDINPLITSGFLSVVQDASKTLATCKQDAIPETEAETEAEAENKNSTSDSTESDNFEALWLARPKRPNESKAKTLKAYKARIREGISPADLFAGVERYRKFCEAEGTEGKYIMLLSTFLNADEHWKQPWAIPERVPDDIDALRRLVTERSISLPENCTLQTARKLVAKSEGMTL